MEISKERLQEIKDKYLLTGNEEWTSQEDVDTEAVIKELIAAYEQAQAEVERYRKHIAIGEETVLELRIEVERLETSQLLRDRERYRKENIDLRAQLAEARLENKTDYQAHLNDNAQIVRERDKFRKELAASQAEVERLQSVLDNAKENVK